MPAQLQGNLPGGGLHGLAHGGEGRVGDAGKADYADGVGAEAPAVEERRCDGLEAQTVFLPLLGQAAGADQRQLLQQAFRLGDGVAGAGA